MTIDDVLRQIQARLALEAETEHEVLEEIRGHLEEGVVAAKARGLDGGQALIEAASAFGVEQTTAELHATHAGWGTMDGVAVAALPVIFALVPRWLIIVAVINIPVNSQCRPLTPVERLSRPGCLAPLPRSAR